MNTDEMGDKLRAAADRIDALTLDNARLVSENTSLKLQLSAGNVPAEIAADASRRMRMGLSREQAIEQARAQFDKDKRDAEAAAPKVAKPIQPPAK